MGDGESFGINQNTLIQKRRFRRQFIGYNKSRYSIAGPMRRKGSMVMKGRKFSGVPNGNATGALYLNKSSMMQSLKQGLGNSLLRDTDAIEHIISALI